MYFKYFLIIYNFRIVLARALYQNADIYIFDDCFKLLDPIVTQKIIKDVFFDYLNNKTILMISSIYH
jgi:ABC-type multidrug transport system fused ATPase/permease subunit